MTSAASRHPPLPVELEFGDGVDGDSYQSPHVLACCPWYDPQATNCSQPHERACWVDFVEQGCKSMVAKLEAFAHTTFPGALHARSADLDTPTSMAVTIAGGDCR